MKTYRDPSPIYDPAINPHAMNITDESELTAHVATSGRCYSIPLDVARELGALRAINAELLAALKDFVAAAERGAETFHSLKGGCLPKARAAIAKAQL